MIKKIVCMITTISLIAATVNFKYSYALSDGQKVITTSLTSSSKYGFPSTIPYEDAQGYSGVYEKDGEPYVVSGSDATSKTVSTQQSSSSNNFSSTTPYNDGTFSGTLSLTRSERLSKSVSGNASIQEAYNKICLVSGKLQHNDIYDPKKLDYNKPLTWEYWEYATVWGTNPFVAGVGNPSVASGFSVNWSGTRATSAYYNSGGYSGTVTVRELAPTPPVWGPVYTIHPLNGYKPPFQGQQVHVGTKVYNYSLSGTVLSNSYIGYYNGTVYKPDTRVWRQNYKGIAENLQVKANIERVLSPHDPVFKGGEKGVLKITITGKAERLKITFPYELTMLDNSLNKEITLNKLSTETMEFEFFVPLEAESRNYNVEVKVFKEGREKATYPSFTVKGYITDNLRTRIR